MGLFSGNRSQASAANGLTITGQVATAPESIGGLARRSRLMSAAIRLIDDHPVTVAIGRPLGDGYGMEELVARISPLFARERGLIRWVALRGSLLYLDMLCPNDDALHELLPAMGLRPEQGPEGPTVAVIEPVADISAITGLFFSIAMRWSQYQQLAELEVSAVNRDPIWAINPAVGLDYIAWIAVAMVRSGAWQSGAMQDMPEPNLLDQPGWYIEPLFAKGERYWDGTDWTSRVRARSGRDWVEVQVPLA